MEISSICISSRFRAPRRGRNYETHEKLSRFHMATVHRIYNFSAGPAVLPLPVLEEIQRDLISLPGVGMSILEISHRSAAFERILGDAEQSIRTLANISSDYK